MNAAFTGELNYQGGERKTFNGRFPFDASGATFDDSGEWMTTNQLGPLVAGRDEEKVTAASGPARAAAEIPESFAWNLGYFWVGRFGGAAAVLLPGRDGAASSSSSADHAIATGGSPSPRSCCPGSPTSGSSPTTGTAGAERWGTATSSACCRRSCFSCPGTGRGGWARAASSRRPCSWRRSSARRFCTRSGRGRTPPAERSGSSRRS